MHSHCSLIHGYALSFKFVFETNNLDMHNWVVDFGDLDPLKNSLRHWFDHTTVIASDDPAKDLFIQMAQAGVIKLRELKSVGCEAFSHHAYLLAKNYVSDKFPHARVVLAEVKEHGANSAIYIPTPEEHGAR